ncbi:hypothetical protein KGM_200532 [Danaus plexippus plexippus]|uniref:PiggyBac transposable element-derived protein domain-containing protein n=1 Tax=Danaus plexippus plexippus TaxID=278856 RepID=A0A212FGP3_DANPL|nr:hypothetical protein KGM_200532 [Danaus plexippus plexippus]
MGGVDLMDSFIGRYRIRIKSRKWTTRLFYHLLDMTVINAWVLYKKANLTTTNAEKIMLSIDEKIKPLIEENKNVKMEIEGLNNKINTLEDLNKKKNNIIIHNFKETDANYT